MENISTTRMETRITSAVSVDVRLTEAEERSKCGDCAEYCRDSEKETRGVCKAKGVFVRQSKPACKKHFRKAMHIWGGKKGEDGKIN